MDDNSIFRLKFEEHQRAQGYFDLHRITDPLAEDFGQYADLGIRTEWQAWKDAWRSFSIVQNQPSRIKQFFIRMLPIRVRMKLWMQSTFPPDVERDIGERVSRFLEEAFELAESLGIKKDSIISILNYVYDREAHREKQSTVTLECAQCHLTLLALEHTLGIAQHHINDEMTRIEDRASLIAARAAAKPKFKGIAPPNSYKDRVNYE